MGKKLVYNTLMKPGETIAPGSSEPPKKAEGKAAPPPEKPTAKTPLAIPDPAPPSPEEAPADVPDSPWKDTTAQADLPPAPSVQPVSWTASEYVAHHRGAGWYMALIVGVAVFTGLVYLATRELVSTVAVALVGLSFGIFAMRKPQVLQYTVGNEGLEIGQKQYSYHLFRSFSVMEEEAIHSILLMPLQRFNLPITIYYDPEDEGAIIAVLGAFLPHEQREVSPIDRLMSKIRF